MVMMLETSRQETNITRDGQGWKEGVQTVASLMPGKFNIVGPRLDVNQQIEKKA